jgi:hypothetical protein
VLYGNDHAGPRAHGSLVRRGGTRRGMNGAVAGGAPHLTRGKAGVRMTVGVFTHRKCCAGQERVRRRHGPGLAGASTRIASDSCPSMSIFMRYTGALKWLSSRSVRTGRVPADGSNRYGYCRCEYSPVRFSVQYANGAHGRARSPAQRRRGTTASVSTCTRSVRRCGTAVSVSAPVSPAPVGQRSDCKNVARAFTVSPAHGSLGTGPARYSMARWYHFVLSPRC